MKLSKLNEMQYKGPESANERLNSSGALSATAMNNVITGPEMEKECDEAEPKLTKPVKPATTPKG